MLKKLIVACVLCLAVVFSVNAEEISLVKNSGFEEGMNRWRIKKGNSQYFSLDNQTSHSGKNSLKWISPEEWTEKRYSWILQSIPVSPDTCYVFRAWCKNKGKSVFGIKELYGKKKHWPVKIKTGKDNSDWTLYEKKITSASTARYFRLHLIPHGKATVWFDDISLVKDEKATDVYRKKRAEEKIEEAKLAKLEKTKIKNISYAYSVEPNHGKDRDIEHAKLIDGKGGNIHWTRSSPEIEFDLKTTYLINRIEIKWYRNRQSWGIKDVSLFMDKGTGYELVNKVETNLDKLPYPARHTLIFENIDKEAHRLKLRVFSGNRYFGISEIKIYGKLKKEVIKKSNKSTNSSYTNFPQSAGELIFKKGSFDSDPEEELFLCNRFFSMIIEPQLGGVISSFYYYKTRNEFTSPKSHKNLCGGILSDHVGQQSYAGDWCNASYSHEVLKKTPDEISIKLSRNGKTGILNFLTFNKIITIYKDKSYIKIDYEINNAPEALTAIPYSLWFHSFAGTRNWKKKGLTYYFPLKTGIGKLDLAVKGGGDSWYHNPARGWEGFINNQEKTGFVFGMDYKYLKCFYNWRSQREDSVPTLEWRFNKIPIPNGGSFKTTVYVFPFNNLEKLSGANKYFAGSLDYQNNKIITKIIAGEKEEKVNLKLRYKILPQKNWTTISEKVISLSPDKTISLISPFRPAKKGTYVFSLILEKAGKELLDLEEPEVIGKSTGAYALLPKKKQYKPEGAVKLDIAYKSLSAETPHVKWAKPYSQGKIKAIILQEDNLTRDVIELAQRVDLDFDNSYYYTRSLAWGLANYVAQVSVSDLDEGIKRVFKENPDWELLIITGKLFRYFKPEQQQDILNKIKAGRGLVVIEPADYSPLTEVSPLINQGSLLKKKKWRKEVNHFITTGIPFAALPSTDLYNYKLKEGEILVSADGKPLLAIKKYGKGRIAGFAYRSGYNRLKKDKPSGLLPLMNILYTDLSPELPTFNYFEYHFSLLAKAILWAAEKEPDILFEGIKPEEDKIVFSLDNKGKKERINLEFKSQDKYGKEAIAKKWQQEIPHGKSEISIAYERILPDGLNIFDLSLKDENNKVINWASASYNVKRTTGIEYVEIGKKVYKPNEDVIVKVTLKGELNNFSLRGRLTDSFGRILAEDEKKLSSATTSFKLPIREPVNHLVYIEVELMKNKEVFDRYIAYRPVPPPIKENAHQGEPNFFSWSCMFYQIGTLNNYRFSPFIKFQSKLGVNGILRPNYNMGHFSFTYALLKNNFSFCASSGAGAGRGAGPKGDPKHPERGRCLNDPDLIKKHKNAVSNRARSGDGYGLIDMNSGDENWYSTPGLDVCFSIHCLKKFREWLQTQYSSLESLNKQWETNFNSWDEVKPLTLKETKAKGNNNFSSWCDHRTFGEITFAQYNGELTKSAKKFNPNLRHGVSGTPYPDSYRGYDYWRLSKAFSSTQCYYGDDELSTFADRSFDLRRWAGGHKEGGKAVKFSVYDHYFRGGTGYNIWCSRMLFNPDWTYSKMGEGFKKYYAPYIPKGVGRLLIESWLTKQAVAMHYSQASSHVSYALGEYSLWKDSRDSFLKLSENCGFAPEWFSYEQIEQGGLKKFKVLYLPCSYSLSKKEIAEIEKFVKDGGFLIAQIGTGIANGHGKFLKNGSLDNLLGIKRGKRQLLRKESSLISSDDNLKIPVFVYETGIKPTSSKVLAKNKEGDSLIFLNHSGKGRTLYFACDVFPSYNSFNQGRTIGKNDKYASSVEDFLTKTLKNCHVGKWLSIVDEKGKSIPFLKVSLFKQGEIDYFCLLRDYRLAKDLSKKPVIGRIKFPSAGYIYEIMEEKDYGFTDTIKTIFAPDTVQIYSFLPYQVKGIKISFTQKSFAAGENVPYQISVLSSEKTSNHTLRLEVFDPKGKIYSPYCKNVSAVSGKAKGVIPLALNDKKGKWTIKVKDLTSGKKTEADFYVK